MEKKEALEIIRIALTGYVEDSAGAESQEAKDIDKAWEIINSVSPTIMDDLNEISLGMVEELVQQKLIPDCQDTDDETEFEVQDIINKKLAEFFGLDYEELQG